MAKLTFAVLALTAITVQADFRSEGSQRRIRRSPSPIESPPSPVFQTHQWSGYQKSSDGRQAGVFSGAAAAADGGSQASGQAFSLASATTGDSGTVLGTGGQVNTGHSEQPDKLESRFGGDDGPIFGSSSQAQSQVGYHGGDNGGFHSGQYGSNQGQSGGGFKESHYSHQKGDYGSFVKGGHSGGYGGGSQAQFQAQSQSSSGSGFSSFQGNHQNSEQNTFDGQQSALGTGHQQQQSGAQSSGYGGSGYQGGNGDLTSAGSAASAGSQAVGNSGQGVGSAQRFDSSQGFNGGQNTGALSNSGASTGYKTIGRGDVPSQGFSAEQKGSRSGLQGYNSGHQGYNSEFQGHSSGHQGHNAELQGYSSGRRGYNSGNDGYSTGQSALNGALNLASQGLQLSPPSSGCSTCGKGNYALSNAKSKTGDAVAVSVGG